MVAARRDLPARALALAFVVVTIALVAVILVAPVYSVGVDVTAPDGSTTTRTTYETVWAANRSAWPLLVGLIGAGFLTSALACLVAWRGSRVARLGLAVVMVALSVLAVAGLASFGTFMLPAVFAGWAVVARSKPPHRVASPKQG